MAQVKVGFSLGGYALTDRYEFTYLDKQVNYGGQMGVNLMVPLFNKKLIFESGLYFYDHKYKVRGPEMKISCGYGSYSHLRNSRDINTSVPLKSGRY